MIVALCTLAGALWLMQLEASHIQPSWLIIIDGYGDVMPQGAIGRCGTLRLRHKGWIGSRGVPRAGSVAFSPNGELLATGGQSVCFWEVSTGKLRRYFQTNDFVRAIAC